jgi:hypothetical protein
MKNEIAEMDKSIRCLALELPKSVHDDVSKTWQALKSAIKTYQNSADLMDALLARFDNMPTDNIPGALYMAIDEWRKEKRKEFHRQDG